MLCLYIRHCFPLVQPLLLFSKLPRLVATCQYILPNYTGSSLGMYVDNVEEPEQIYRIPLHARVTMHAWSHTLYDVKVCLS
jgi:hypothetical protein